MICTITFCTAFLSNKRFLLHYFSCFCIAAAAAAANDMLNIFICVAFRIEIMKFCRIIRVSQQLTEFTVFTDQFRVFFLLCFAFSLSKSAARTVTVAKI